MSGILQRSSILTINMCYLTMHTMKIPSHFRAQLPGMHFHYTERSHDSFLQSKNLPAMMLQMHCGPEGLLRVHKFEGTKLGSFYHSFQQLSWCFHSLLPYQIFQLHALSGQPTTFHHQLPRFLQGNHLIPRSKAEIISATPLAVLMLELAQ